MFKIYIFVIAFVVGGVGSWTLEECEELQPSYICSQTFERKYQAAIKQGSRRLECLAIKDYITCMEQVGCDCNMTISYDTNTALTYIEHVYGSRKCNEISGLGDLPDANGIVCDKWNLTINETHGGLIDMQFGAAEYLLALDKNCSGIIGCYQAYDSEGGLAVYNRNMSELCLSLDRLVVCLDNAACACNGENSTDVVYQVLTEDYYYRQTCGDVNVPGHELVPRIDVRCHVNGTAKTRSICDTADPSYKCYIKYESTLYEFGDDVMCPATKEYIECVEEVACQCGLLVDKTIFFTLTSAIDYYNRSGCSFSESIEVIHGVNCPDGSGTKDVADRIALDFAENSYVAMQEKWCPGVKRCYQKFDESAGVALFEKDNFKMCLHNRVWVECLELAFCDCGVYDYDNTTYEMATIRQEHEYSCYTDVVLRTDFKCEYGNIGFKCSDNSDCMVVADSKCNEVNKVCDCKSNTKFIPGNMTCTPTVSGATTPESRIGLFLVGLLSLVFVMEILKE